jgi:hypothetical protein
VDFVQKELDEGVRQEDIPDRIITAAISRGSLDNCTVIIVFFQ